MVGRWISAPCGTYVAVESAGAEGFAVLRDEEERLASNAVSPRLARSSTGRAESPADVLAHLEGLRAIAAREAGAATGSPRGDLPPASAS